MKWNTKMMDDKPVTPNHALQRTWRVPQEEFNELLSRGSPGGETCTVMVGKGAKRKVKAVHRAAHPRRAAYAKSNHRHRCGGPL